MALAHTLGFPRIGRDRELKKAQEAFWKGELDEAGLRAVGRQLRAAHWQVQKDAGIQLLPVGDFAWYDQVLTHSLTFGVIPERFRAHGEAGPTLHTLFGMARGVSDDSCCGGAHAQEMTKWFDTNYHYLVPEFSADQQFQLSWEQLFEEVDEARALGHQVKPVLIGPLTYLWLGKGKGAEFDRLDLLDRLLPLYGQILRRLAGQGVEWVQIDEPILVLDLPQAWKNAFERAYNLLQSEPLKKLVATYFGGLEDNLGLAANLPVDGLHIDLVRAPEQYPSILDRLPAYKVVSLGLVNGRNRLGLARRRKRFRVAVASNPEFLKEGSAVDDFRRPDRVIIGSAETQAGETLRQLYAPFLRNHERVLLMGRREAEFSKYAANAFLATKISFMNEMAGLCALTGVDIEDVRRGMGSDKRIGTHFIYAGCGYGGSCFPKDVRALIRSAEQQGFDSQILRAVEARNARQKELLFETLGELFQGRWQGRTVALWGLAFKPGTDDLREAPSLVLLEALLRHGVRVRAHDPVANAGVAARYPDALACAQLTLHDSPYAAVEGADALVLVTEWKQFRQPDFQKIRGSMRTPLLVDGRNLYAPARMAELGFIYQGIGRPRAGHCKASAA